MRKSLSVVALLTLAAASLAAQDSTHTVCREAPCLLVFDWSNGGSPPDPDKRYGAPSDLEQAFRSRLTESGDHDGAVRAICRRPRGLQSVGGPQAIAAKREVLTR